MFEVLDDQYLKMAKRMFVGAKDSDDLVLDDTTISSVITGAKEFTDAEYKALMDSPLTLRRLKVLMEQTPKDQRKNRMCLSIYDMVK